MPEHNQRPVPKTLARHGVTRVEDNVPAGCRVAAPSAIAVRLFGEALRVALAERRRGGGDA